VEAEPDDLTDALARAAFTVMAQLSRIGADNDLSLTQLRALGILRDRRLRMTELAGFLGLEKSTLSGLIDRAEKRGLVERAPSPADRRATDVFLSPRGMEVASQIHESVRRALAPMTGGLAPADQRRLQALLERMLDQHVPGA
jgi:DNA-binding MarR family transcriptional regulator